jgi:hypothetical protein
MSLYRFDEIYYRVVGEYENDIQILFFETDKKDILVFDFGGFSLVNKPAHLDVSGFTRLFEDRANTYCIKRITYRFVTGSDGYTNHETYVELEEAVMKIAWHFSTVSGQQEKKFWLFFKHKDRATYEDLLREMESTKKEEVSDLRFISQAV